MVEAADGDVYLDAAAALHHGLATHIGVPHLEVRVAVQLHVCTGAWTPPSSAAATTVDTLGVGVGGGGGGSGGGRKRRRVDSEYRDDEDGGGWNGRAPLPVLRAMREGEVFNVADFVVVELMEGGSLADVIRRKAIATAALGAKEWPWRARLASVGGTSSPSS